MPEVSVVIVNYNTKDKLRECLESLLRECSDLDLEIIVVDNGSKDGSREMLQDYPQVRLIAPENNTWFTGGNNLGIQAAQSPYVWMLNPDTILQKNTLQTMLNYLKSHPEVGAVTCRMEFPTGGLQATCSKRPHYLDLLLGYTFLGVLFSAWRNQRRAKMWYEDWQRASSKAVEVLPGSNILAPRDLLLEIGFYDEALKLYFVEDDACPQMLERGKELHFIGDALLLHYEHASVEQVQRLASQIYFDDLLVFCRKYYGFWRTILLQCLMLPTRWGMDLAQRLRGEKAQL